jgi:hypothetical protein
MIGLDVVRHWMEQIVGLEQVFCIATDPAGGSSLSQKVPLIRAVDVLARKTCWASATAGMRHHHNPITVLEALRLGSIDHHSDSLMPKFAGVLTLPPGLPLRAHRRNQDPNLDDVSCCPWFWTVRNYGVTPTLDLYAANGFLLTTTSHSPGESLKGSALRYVTQQRRDFGGWP